MACSEIRRLLYSISDAAHALSISERSVYNLIYDGTLRSVKLGSRTLIPVEDILAVANGAVRQGPNDK